MHTYIIYIYNVQLLIYISHYGDRMEFYLEFLPKEVTSSIITIILLLISDPGSSIRDSCNLHSVSCLGSRGMEKRRNKSRGNVFNVSDTTISGDRAGNGKILICECSSGLIIAIFTPPELAQSLASGQFWLHLGRSYEQGKVYGFILWC